MVVVLILLVALYMLLGRWFTWSVTSNQEEIENYLRNNGLPYLEVGTITGDWKIHDPWFELHQVVLAPDGETVLEIDHVSARLSSFQSLLHRGPVVTEMMIDGVRFGLERSENGLSIKGLPRGDRKFNSKYLLDSVSHVDQLTLSGIEILLEDGDLSLAFESIVGTPIEIRAFGSTRGVQVPFTIDRRRGGESIRRRQVVMSGEYSGDPRTPEFTAELYLEAPNLAVLDYLPEIRFSGRHLSTMVVDSNIWFRINPEEVDVSGSLAISNVVVDQRRMLEKISGDFRFHGPSLSEGRLSLPNTEIMQGGFTLNLERVSMVVAKIAGELNVAGTIPQLDIESVMQLVGTMGQEGLIPDRLQNALRSVSPKGELNELHFKTDLSGNGARLVGRVDGFSMDAYLGVPAISRLNGFLSIEPDGGYLDIDNDDFVMDFREMFPEPWDFDSGRGRVAFQVLDDGVSVSSGLIELIRGDLEAIGKVVINLPRSRDAQTWGLAVGIQEAELVGAHRYIPLTVSQDVLTWLDTAIQGGASPRSGVTVHGALYRGSPAVRKSYDFFLDVESADLRYHPDWPMLEDVKGVVHVSNYAIRSDFLTGRALDSSIDSGSVHAAISPERNVDTIIVNAAINGPFADGIRVLNETPLAETTGSMARQWEGTGEMQANLRLNVPIGPRSDEEVTAEVQLSYDNAVLNMPEFDLRIDGLAGRAHYSTESMVSSSGFTGRMFDEEVAGSIRTEIGGDGGEIRVSVNGQIQADRLHEWSDQILISRANGMIGYEAIVHVPFGGDEDRTFVTASSDLAGVTLDMPYPLGKEDAESTRQFEYRQTFMEPGFRVEMSLDEGIKASLKIEDGLVTGGRIHLGEEPMGVTTYNGVRLTGELLHLNLEEWLDAFDELSVVSDVSLADEVADHIEFADLLINEFNIYGMSLDGVHTHVTRKGKAWNARLDSKMLLGDVLVPDAEEAPIVVNLERLTIVSEADEADPLGDIDPSAIDPVNFSTALLTIDGEDYGSWAFEYRPSESGAWLNNLTATAAGVNVMPGSQVEWRQLAGGHESFFTGELVIDNLADALTKFGFASSIEGTDLKLRPVVSWPGSPAMIDVDLMKGDVNIEEGKGRFIQAETGGALKIIGIFDFASIGRRLRLDFSDVIQKGFEFQDIEGVTSFDTGLIVVKEPIVIKGTSGSFTVGGFVNMNTRELDNDMIVTLPLTRTLPWYAAYSAIATGPLAGAGILIAQRVLQKPLNAMSSARYQVSGTIEEPVIEFVSIFSDKVREVDVESIENGVPAPVPQGSENTESTRRNEVPETSESE